MAPVFQFDALPKSSRTTRSLRPLAWGFALLLLLAAAASTLTLVVMEIQAGANAYIVGEGHWSKAQQDAVLHLNLYSVDGRAEQLQRARGALQVPLADHQARLALNRSPPQLEVARQGFIEGRNSADDALRMVRMYRLFGGAPYFRDAIAIWTEADQLVLQLADLADRLELAAQSGQPTDVMRAELLALNAQLRPLEEAFSARLLQGSHALHRALLVASIVGFVLMAVLALWLLRRTRQRIRASEAPLQAAFSQTAVGMAKLDSGGAFLAVNDALCRILDQTRETLLDIGLPDTLAPLDPLRQRLATDPTSWSEFGQPSERRFVRRDGSSRWLRWSASRIEDPIGRGRVFVVLEDVSEARAMSEEIAYQAAHDALTGLYNRREIERRLELALASAKAGDQHYSLCFIDLDQFKLVNDTCGHVVGDRLLRRVSAELAMQLRDCDVIGRLGGDEFAAILEHAGDEGALHVARKLSAALAAFTFTDGERSFNLTGSIGMVDIDADTSDVNWVLGAADAACYLAKEEGRNRIRHYVDSDVAIARRRSEMELVAEIRKALADGRVQLHAQRIRELADPESLRYELLVRFVGSDGTVHPPAAYIAAAERYGQVALIDRHVVGLALQTLAANPAHLTRLQLCHVNISAQSLSDPAFCDHVEQLLVDSPVPASKLCFELTETAAIVHLPLARDFIARVQALGCQVALDDFGSGLSSFGYLKNLPVDILKIDRLFLRDIAEDLIDLALVRAICEVGRTLGKRTIAEGIESEAVLAKLAEVGVEFVQGYAIHRPCPLAEVIAASAARVPRRGPVQRLEQSRR